MRFLPAVVLIAIVLPNLPFPLHGDQALFLLDGQLLWQGKLPYRDFWDLKQPGVFAFYAIAGGLFGFHEVGLHLFEAIYWLAFALFLTRTWPTLSGEQPSPWPAFLTVGWYYAVTGSMQQTQVEALVGPVLYLQWWLLCRRPTLGWCAPGLAGMVFAATLLLKFLFAPLGAWIWLWSTWRMPWPMRVRTTVAFAIGAISVLAAASVPFVVLGEGSIVRQTFFDLPPRMMAELPATPISRLIVAWKWFAVRYCPVILLAMIGGWDCWQHGRRRLLGMLTGWIVLASGIVVIQRLSWWNYHCLLLALPMGLFAAMGANRLMGQRWLLAILMMPLVLATVMKYHPFVQHHGGLTRDDRLRYLLDEDATYRECHESSRFLREANVQPGPIFVVGTPVMHLVTGRPQATVEHGWAMELYVADWRVRLIHELEQARPDFIFVQRSEASMVHERYPEMEQWLGQQYHLAHADGFGTWYEREK